LGIMLGYGEDWVPKYLGALSKFYVMGSS
jgi:hypothetical protein